MGQYTIKDIQNNAEIIKKATDNIYRAIYTKNGFIANSLDEIATAIMDIPDLPTEEPLTITPITVEQGFSTGSETKYNPITVEPVTSAIDGNIQPENIKEGVVILGVTGTLSGGGSDVFVVPSDMKFGYSTFTEISSNWDFSNVTNMSHMFYSCKALTTIPLLDTSKVTDMNYMFYEDSKLTSIPQLDTHNVTGMSYMFYSCSNLTAIPQLDTHNVTKMNSMFNGCSILTTIPQLNTANVTNMSNMFANCSGLTTVEGIDFSGLTSNLTELFGWDTNKSMITRFIVNGKINVSISDNNGIKALTAIDYDSVKSILAAADRTDNTNSKTLAFNRTIADQNGELAALVASCSTKGWTISGLTLQ